MDVVTQAVLACEPRDVSALFFLHYIAQAGNSGTPGSLARLISTAGGAQESRFVGGAERISTKLARQLGKRIVLGAPVRRIESGGGGVIVHAKGATVRARRAIIAIPPTLAGRIAYDPILPALRDQLTQRLPQGSAIKVQAVYDEPFLARRRAQRTGTVGRWRGQGDLRQHAAERLPRRARRLRRGP